MASEWEMNLKSDKAPEMLSEIINILQLTIDTLRGYHGSGEYRKKSLGIYYNQVQSLINYIYQTNLI